MHFSIFAALFTYYLYFASLWSVREPFHEFIVNRYIKYHSDLCGGNCYYGVTTKIDHARHIYFSAKVGLKLLLRLISSCYGQKTLCCRPASCWLGWGPWTTTRIGGDLKKYGYRHGVFNSQTNLQRWNFVRVNLRGSLLAFRSSFSWQKRFHAAYLPT